jgi:type I restriction enzyme S subunit
MNAARLLALYERIAEAPDAVARLRRFVLDLAVRGKLVAQHAQDEPASELLSRITAKRARLVKAGSLRRLDIEPIAGTDAPFSVPLSWVWTRLGAIGDWGSGSTPPRGSTELFGGGVSWFKSGELNDNRRLAGSEETITDVALDRCSFRLNQPGDVLVAMYGATIGKVAILSERAVTNQAVCGCTPINGVFNEYLFLFLLSCREQFLLASEGGAQPNISKVKIVRTPFPLPPLAEQHRIVAKVDELMALCDRLEAAQTAREATRDRLAAASLARLNTPEPETFPADARFTLDALPALTTRPDQIKHLRQTILNLAVRGKLVPQDARDEPVSSFLKRIGTHNAVQAGDRARRQAVQQLPATAAPYPIPRGWAWVRFGDITVCRDGERIPVSKEERSVRGKVYDYYGASGVIDQIDGYLFDKPLLLIGEDGANLVNRSTPIAFIARGVYWVNNHAHVIDGVSEDFLLYLELFINATDLKPYITGAAQPKMNQAKMNSIPVALPPPEEQHRIVAKVNDLMALCDTLEASLAAATTARTRLLEATLAEALAPVEAREMEAAE